MAIEVKPRANEIKLSIDMYKEAQRQKLTFSQYLETIDSSESYGPNEKLDAFERQLKRFDIKVANKPEKGIYASDVEAFFLTEESKVLFPEFISRVAREEQAAGSILPELIAINTPIDSNVYVPYYVDDQPAEQSKRRVTEAAQLPLCEIKGQEHSIKLYKYGRAIKASYEAIRRMKIDMLALHVKRIAQQTSLDKALDAIDVIVNGDGNNNAAKVFKLGADLGGDLSNGLDYKSWLKFLMNFYPYHCTTVIGGLDEVVGLLTMQMPNVDPLVLVSMLQQGPVNARMQLGQDLFVNYRVLYLPDAPEKTLIAIDKGFAVEQLTEIGSDIMESEKFIMNQTSVLTVSENNGFAKIFNKATAVLDLAN